MSHTRRLITALPSLTQRVSRPLTRNRHVGSEDQLAQSPHSNTSKLVGLGIDQVPINQIKGRVSPLSRYNQLVQAQALRDDTHQRTIISQLEHLHNQLLNYNPPDIPETHHPQPKTWYSRFFPPKPLSFPPTNAPRGMYLFGDVGCGKTMLMDLFYSTLPDKFHSHRKRIHFHAFMLDVFRRVHAIKHGLSTANPPTSRLGNMVKDRIRLAKAYNPMAGRSDERAFGVEALHGGGLFSSLFPPTPKGMEEEDAIYEAARELADEGRILCFDEFQVTDIVTAMILRQLMERLMDYGVVCVVTSNRHPDELYKNGIQRQSFLPCIQLIKDKFDIVDLDSKTDYRKLPRALSKVYFHPLSPSTHTELDKLFQSLTSPNPISTSLTLRIWGRTLTIPESSITRTGVQVARFNFEKLCGEPLSSADYLEVTGRFGVIFVEGMPRLGVDRKDAARRFITFIDACYENKTKLFISSEVPVFEIFGGEEAKPVEQVSAHMRSIMDDLGLTQDAAASSGMFSGDEEFFAWARCVSRLTQMGTKEWANSSRLE